MENRKPALEAILPDTGSSFHVKQFSNRCDNKTPNWHFHPEIELVYVKGGHGKRFIGSHFSYYRDGELVLIGSNLPHYGFTDRLTGNMSEVVVQMKEDFCGETFWNLEEMKSIQNLLERARLGIAFGRKTQKEVGPLLEEISSQDNFEKLLQLLKVLRHLSVAEDFEILNARGVAMQIDRQDNDRINTIFDHVKENFQQTITIAEVADLAFMTEPSFCRYFKKVTSKTFTKFVNEYRLVQASKLLHESNLSITEVCFESGFNNFSHFAKLFKEFTGKSPRQYRNTLKQIIE